MDSFCVPLTFWVFIMDSLGCRRPAAQLSLGTFSYEREQILCSYLGAELVNAP